MNTTIILIAAMLAFSVLLPLVFTIVWGVKKHVRFWTFFVGALTFVFFAIGLEQVCNYFCLVDDNTVSRFINSNTMFASLYGALAAAVFEETGRLFAFKVMLRRKNTWENGVAYGVGHGGIELILSLGVTYIFLLMFNLGYDFGPANGNLLMTTLSLSVPTCLVAAGERISALVFHIGASMFVFKAAKQHKIGYYFLMILAHASMDLFVMPVRVGILPVWSVEVFAAVTALAVLIDALRICRN